MTDATSARSASLPAADGASAPRLFRRLWLACAAGGFALAAATSVKAQQHPAPAPPAPAPDDTRARQLQEMRAASGEVMDALRSAGPSPLGALEVVRRLSADSARGETFRQVVALEGLRLAAEVGAWDEALRYADVVYGDEPTVPADPSALSGRHAADALEYVTAVAETARVVMINEAHHVPQHRVFTLRLLAALRARGYRYFAAETLSDGDAELARRGYPTLATGPYIGEPVYGDLVRTALRLGYVVVPYEADRAAPDRERSQAEHLAHRILDHDPAARIVVHAGYNHVNESGTLAGSLPMAARFRQLTGIDPFTIDQTVMSERASPTHEHPLYRRVATTLHAPTVFVDVGGHGWSLEPEKRDLTVFHPRTTLRDGRPDWLRVNGDRRPLTIPAGVCGMAPRCLVRARLASEGDDAVPVDQVEVVAGHPAPVLLLPPGEYVVRAESAAGTLLRGWTGAVSR
jgi:hypothetical protein